MKRLLCIGVLFFAGSASAQTVRQFPPAGATGNYRASSGAPVVDLNFGLAHYWKMDEATGVQREDSLHTFHVWALVGGPTQVAGKSGNGTQVSPGNYIRNSFTADLFSPSFRALTMTFWVNPASYTESGSGSPILIASSIASGFDVAKQQASTNIQLKPYGGGTTVNLGSVLNAGSGWHFVAVMYDGGGGCCGVVTAQVDNGAIFQVTPEQIYGDNSNSMFFGYIAGNSMTGVVDEVGVWTRVLTLAERQDLWNSGNGHFYPF